MCYLVFLERCALEIHADRSLTSIKYWLKDHHAFNLSLSLPDALPFFHSFSP